MGKRLIAIVFFASSMLIWGASMTYAQHENHQSTPAEASSTPNLNVMEHIFCPTMKTGQLCSHGTAATLMVSAEKNDAWVAIARKYNRAVNAATEQLFADAESVLTPEQLSKLKAWFAVGLNPQINELLYAKGMGVKQQAKKADAAVPAEQK